MEGERGDIGPAPVTRQGQGVKPLHPDSFFPGDIIVPVKPSEFNGMWRSLDVDADDDFVKVIFHRPSLVLASSTRADEFPDFCLVIHDGSVGWVWERDFRRI